MSDLDLGVATRQAFGEGLVATRADESSCLTLERGELSLPPHPTWLLPRPLTWGEDPFGDRSWTAQLHSLRWLDPLRRAASSGDASSSDRWVATALSWVVANPPTAPAHPQAWAGRQAGVRAVVLTLGLPLAAGDERVRLVRSLTEHVDWLCAEQQSARAHALLQHQGLFVAARAVGRHDATDLAVRRLGDLLEQSLGADAGPDPDPAQRQLTLARWQLALRRLEVEEVAPPPASSLLSRAAELLAHTTRPDGLLETIGETAATAPTKVTSPFLEYVRTAGATGTRPTATTDVVTGVGAFGRSGWGEQETAFAQETFYSLRLPTTPGPHQDGGSITFFARGRPWIVDPGPRARCVEPVRSHLSSRAAHNLPVVVGRERDTDAGARSVHHRHSSQLDHHVVADDGYPGVTLRRHVVYHRGGDFLLVLDRVVADEECTVEQLWHLPPDVAARVAAPGGPVVLADGEVEAGLSLRGSEQVDVSVLTGRSEPVQGWVSTPDGARASTTVVSRLRGTEMWLLAVVGGSHRTATALEDAAVEGDELTCTVRSRGERSRVVLPLGVDGLGSSATSASTPPVTRAWQLLAGPAGPPDVPAGDPARAVAAARQRAADAHGDLGTRRDLAAQLLLHLGSLGEPSDAGPDLDHGLRAAVIDLLGDDATPQQESISSLLLMDRQPLLPWTASSERRSRLPVRWITDVLAPGGGAVPASVSAHTVEGLVMPFAVGEGDGDTLLVRIHGALDRGRFGLPAFRGLGVDIRERRPFLHLQDPTLDLDRNLSLGWFLGTRAVDAQREAAELVRRIATRMGRDRIVVMGNSGGGYVALVLAALLGDATALAINPQIDLREWHRPLVERALRAGLGQDVAVEDLPGDWTRRVSLPDLLDQQTFTARALVVQNTGDTHHMQQHLPRLRAAVSDHLLQDRVQIEEVDLGQGHVALAPDRLAAYIARATDPDAPWIA